MFYTIDGNGKLTNRSLVLTLTEQFLSKYNSASVGDTDDSDFYNNYNNFISDVNLSLIKLHIR